MTKENNIPTNNLEWKLEIYILCLSFSCTIKDEILHEEVIIYLRNLDYNGRK